MESEVLHNTAWLSASKLDMKSVSLDLKGFRIHTIIMTTMNILVKMY